MRKIKVPRRVLDRVVNRNQKIKSCDGVYAQSEVAKYFGISRQQVSRIWKLTTRDPELEPPNIWNTKRNPALYEDAVALGIRGLSVSESAKQLGVSEGQLRAVLKRLPTGRELLDRETETREPWQRERSHHRRPHTRPVRHGDPSWPNKI